MKRIMLCVASIVAFSLAPVQTDAGVLYTQASNNFGFFYSQNDTSGSGALATTYDNFTLGADATIANVSWVGGFLQGSPTNGITSFTITFYGDSSGAPGSPLLPSETIPGNAGQTFLGTDFFNDSVFAYDANLPVPVAVSGGTQYWLSIVANLNTGGNFVWGWENSNDGDGVGYQGFPPDAAAPITSDSAFTLSDVATVPEPASLGLWSLAGAVAAFAGWCRRQVRAE